MMKQAEDEDGPLLKLMKVVVAIFTVCALVWCLLFTFEVVKGVKKKYIDNEVEADDDEDEKERIYESRRNLRRHHGLDVDEQESKGETDRSNTEGDSQEGESSDEATLREEVEKERRQRRQMRNQIRKQGHATQDT